MCPTGLLWSRANSSGAEAPFWGLGLSVAGGIVSFKVYGRRDGFGFEMVGFPFLGGGVPRSPSCGVCVSQLVCFAGVCSSVGGFGGGGLFLAAGLLRQGYGYHKIRRAFSKFYHRHSGLIVKYNIGLGALLQQGMSEPIFYGGLVCGFKLVVDSNELLEGLVLVINSKR